MLWSQPLPFRSLCRKRRIACEHIFAFTQSSSSGLSTEGGTPSSAGMQVAAGFATLLYLPVKVAFAIGGGIVGGLAYAFSGGNEHAAKSIWDTSLYGTYLITPDHLQGNRPIRF